jgi:hypothetical protein
VAADLSAAIYNDDHLPKLMTGLHDPMRLLDLVELENPSRFSLVVTCRDPVISFAISAAWVSTGTQM